MAVRTLRLEGDELLRKISREVTEMTDKIKELIQDMKETMYVNEGVGLAAPQIGVLKRIIVVDVSDIEEDDETVQDDRPNGAIALINPQIVEKKGEQIGIEGCLSVPDTSGDVKRPYEIVVKAKNENFEDILFTARAFFARAICHEIDHLDGVLYIDKLEDIDEEAKKVQRRKNKLKRIG